MTADDFYKLLEEAITASKGKSVIEVRPKEVPAGAEPDKTVTGDVDLSGRRFRKSLELTAFVFDGHVELSHATINGYFSTGSCTYKEGIGFSGTTVDQSVFFNAGTSVCGAIDLRARVNDRVSFEGVVVTTAPDELAIDMTGARILGGVCFLPDERKDLPSIPTRIRGDISLNQAKVVGGIRTTLYVADKPPRPKAAAAVACRIDGMINLDYADISGPLLMHAASVSEHVSAKHLKVHGDLSLVGSVIGHGMQQVGADFHSVTWTEQEIRKLGFTPPSLDAKIVSGGLKLSLRKKGFEGDKPWTRHRAVDLELARIEGNLSLMHTDVWGELFAEEATVRGELNMLDAQLAGDLILRHTEVNGRVFADETGGKTPYPRVMGIIDLSYSKLQQVDVRFDGDDQTTRPRYLNLTGASITSLTIAGRLGAQDRGGTTIGVDDLTFSTIDCGDLERNPKPGWSINDTARAAFVAVVFGAAACFAYASENLSLQIALPIAALAVVLFRIELSLWSEAERWKTHLNGIESNEASRDKLLGLLNQTYPFSQGFYRKVELWLRSDGNDALANEVFLCARKRDNDAPRPLPSALADRGETLEVRKELDMRGGALRRTGMWLLDTATGYGVRPGRLLSLWLMLLLLSICVFANRVSVERPLSYSQPRKDLQSSVDVTGERIERSETEQPWIADGGKPSPSEWDIGHAAFMAMRVHVPFMSLLTEGDWQPASRRMTGKHWGEWADSLTYENYAAVMGAINLLLVPLTIAGLAGFLKRDR
jgi:hypothetical protein